MGVGRLAQSLGVPCIALCGAIGEGADAVLKHGLDSFVSIAPGPGSLEIAMAETAIRLERATERAEELTRSLLAIGRGQMLQRARMDMRE